MSRLTNLLAATLAEEVSSTSNNGLYTRSCREGCNTATVQCVSKARLGHNESRCYLAVTTVSDGHDRLQTCLFRDVNDDRLQTIGSIAHYEHTMAF